MSLDWAALSERELAAFSLAGREAAFVEIMRRHRSSIFRMVRGYIGETDEALDLVQETFVAAFQAMPHFDGARPMRAWLATIAINKCRDWGRKRSVRRLITLAMPSGTEAVSDGQVDITDASADRERLARVTREIARLPGPLKETLILRTIEGLSQAETAAVLSISAKAVETRLHRARYRLVERLARPEG